MGIREGARPKTPEQLQREAELRAVEAERQAVKNLSDPVLIRERIEREKAIREANPEPAPQEATPEQRAALRKLPQHRTAEDRAILSQIGIQ